MDIKAIISEIDAEIAKLASIREALQETSAEQGSGRPLLSTKATPVAKKKAKRKISAEGRSRMAAAQKVRWAKVKSK